jgi:gliding motility-associated-like protein
MRIFPFLMLMLLVSTGLSSQTGNDKIVAAFSFNNCKGADETGNGSNGAFIGGLGCSCGVRDTAIQLDGDDDAVFFVGPLGDVFTTSDFTVSFYIRPDEKDQTLATQVVMAKQEDCSTDHAFWVRYSRINRIISSGISESDTLLTTVTAQLDDDVCWQYVSLVRKGNRYSIYLNNSLRDTKTTKTRIDISTSAILKIAEPVCPLDNRFQGAIDELRIHSKALEIEEQLPYYYSPNRILNGDTLIYLGNSLQINATSTCAEKFIWTPQTGVVAPTDVSPIITPSISQSYTLESFFDDGCSTLDSIFIKVIDPDTLNCNSIFVPNAFTPGASPGRNDRFFISNPFSIDEFLSFEVYDRWGGRVFNAADQFDSWDGNFQGQPLNPGIFLYRLRYNCDGEERLMNGTLTLLR